ncbi:unnamed protein product, partial [Meganyctiphanes norvegica]
MISLLSILLLAACALAQNTRGNLAGGFGRNRRGGNLGGGGFAGFSGSCRYWCRTPQGQAYCCEGGNQPVSRPNVKPGRCPPVRPQCPPTRGFRPPS